MFVQFGYVFLFSSVYPLASFFAVMNNVFEIRVDAFKLCRLYRRPMGRRVKDTGAWQVRKSVLQLVQFIRSSKKITWHLLSFECFKLPSTYIAGLARLLYLTITPVIVLCAWSLLTVTPPSRKRNCEQLMSQPSFM
jgi:hypothetical protein